MRYKITAHFKILWKCFVPFFIKSSKICEIDSTKLRWETINRQTWLFNCHLWILHKWWLTDIFCAFWDFETFLLVCLSFCPSILLKKMINIHSLIPHFSLRNCMPALYITFLRSIHSLVIFMLSKCTA